MFPILTASIRRLLYCRNSNAITSHSLIGDNCLTNWHKFALILIVSRQQFKALINMQGLILMLIYHPQYNHICMKQILYGIWLYCFRIVMVDSCSKYMLAMWGFSYYTLCYISVAKELNSIIEFCFDIYQVNFKSLSNFWDV